MTRAVGAVRRAWAATGGRALQALLVGLILGYKKVLSPMLGPRCRYHPSCSTYGLEAVRVHGAGKGSVLTVWRICRCNPWTRGGVDPVPPRGAWKPEPYVPLEDHSDVTAALAAQHEHDPGPAPDDRPDRSAA